MEITHKPIGVGLKVGYAKGRDKTIIYIHQVGSELSQTVKSEVAIKYMEEDLVKTEEEIARLQAEAAKNKEAPVSPNEIADTLGYFLEHLEELLIDSAKPLEKAAYFGVLFEELPTYQDLVSGTPKLAPCIATKKGPNMCSVPVGELFGSRTLQREFIIILIQQS